MFICQVWFKAVFRISLFCEHSCKINDMIGHKVEVENGLTVIIPRDGALCARAKKLQFADK